MKTQAQPLDASIKLANQLSEAFQEMGRLEKQLVKLEQERCQAVAELEAATKLKDELLKKLGASSSSSNERQEHKSESATRGPAKRSKAPRKDTKCALVVVAVHELGLCTVEEVTERLGESDVRVVGHRLDDASKRYPHLVAHPETNTYRPGPSRLPKSLRGIELPPLHGEEEEEEVATGEAAADTSSVDGLVRKSLKGWGSASVDDIVTDTELEQAQVEASLKRVGAIGRCSRGEVLYTLP